MTIVLEGGVALARDRQERFLEVASRLRDSITMEIEGQLASRVCSSPSMPQQRVLRSARRGDESAGARGGAANGSSQAEARSRPPVLAVAIRASGAEIASGACENTRKGSPCTCS